MIRYIVHIRREKRLVVVVDAGGNIGPPEKGLHKGGAVVQTHSQLHTCTVGCGGFKRVCVGWERRRVVLQQQPNDQSVETSNH